MSDFFTTSDLTSKEAMAYNGYIQFVEPQCENKVAEANKKAGNKLTEAQKQKLFKECVDKWFSERDVTFEPGYGIVGFKPKAGETGTTRSTNPLDYIGLGELAESPYLLIGGAVLGLIVVGVLIGRVFR